MKFSTINEWLSSGGLAFTLMVIAQGAAVIAANGMWRGEQPVSSAPPTRCCPGLRGFTENRWTWVTLRWGPMQQQRHWLDHDPVALAVLVVGIGMIELLALLI
jgi:hypothetical protein